MVENLLTRHYFNGVAKDWNSKQSEKDIKIHKMLSNLELQRCTTILDIGCGTGVLFPFLAKLTQGYAKIFAIDFAECMAREAAQQNYPATNVLCGCARYLPFLDNSFDLIIAFHVIPHIQGKSLALKECWRVLKPYGKLAIIHLHGSQEINAIHEEIGGTVKDHRLQSGEQMGRMLKKINFEIKEIVDRKGEYFVVGQKKLAVDLIDHSLIENSHHESH
jgi:ubiquinone/menaquinone biosynthesis C-methylase UbiE